MENKYLKHAEVEIYPNVNGEIVISQPVDCMNEDYFVYFSTTQADAIIAAIKALKADIEGGKFVFEDEEEKQNELGL